MYIEDDKDDFKINIYKWKGEDRVDVELILGDYNPLELGFRNLTTAKEFVKKLQSAEVRKFNVNERGEITE
ncbi:hypothetical protein [Clostridium sp. HBUAS56010]|uniref:hypothetical protein n=1 Tax=Clostridium sp. HBUAS56010 TaxID=2571127 RepID=UPI00117820F8|nr:hypothetical protein [Clostridium sp. HBUAS56010]